MKHEANKVYLEERKRQEIRVARERAKFEADRKLEHLKNGKKVPGFFSGMGKGLLNVVDGLTEPPKPSKKPKHNKKRKKEELNVFEQIDNMEINEFI